MVGMQPSASIGLLNETHFHAGLKRLLAPPGARFEVSVDGYVVDAVHEGLLIEVQTRNVASMREKLAVLVPAHRLRLVLPVADRKWIVRCYEDGRSSRRRSPRRGVAEDAFRELVSIPQLLDHPNFEVEIVLTEQEELRRFVAGKAWRRNGWVVAGRRLLSVTGRRLLQRPADLLSFLPEGLPSPFTTADLAVLGGYPRRTAQQTTYCLRLLGLIETSGKQGNTLQYRVAATSGAEAATDVDGLSVDPALEGGTLAS